MNKYSQPPSDPALASVSGSLRCRKCGKTAHEIGGYLHRVNELGVKGVWECRPLCEAAMTPDDRVIAAIEGAENADLRHRADSAASQPKEMTDEK